MSSYHIYFRNRRQYRLDKLWDKIEETEKKRIEVERLSGAEKVKYAQERDKGFNHNGAIRKAEAINDI